ncbi:MAG: VPLPA-CTERM sorting domain-containing protein [Gammaproteobacteria bacterium]|nr:VPLPA-CTERM sorting domain-containing protein [Gammaproteobacteria bacterium]
MRVALPLVALCWAINANASTVVQGVAVGDPGNGATPGFGSIGDGPSLSDAIEYFIPLSDAANGTYGKGSLCGSNGAGTCADNGSGSGYTNSDALFMNIFFDLSAQPASQSAALAFEFDDLDLINKNDPVGFFESISLSYWNWDGTDFATVAQGGTITTAGASPLPVIDAVDENLVTWDLNLAALGALNKSADEKGGFWIQLGFGSDFSGNTGRNTPEYLTAELTVSPVPVPAAIWLFGTALIGFVGMSRRIKIS